MLRKLDNGQAETSRFLAAERDLLALGVEYLPLPEIGREGKGLISGFIPGQTRVRKDTTSATTGGEEGRNFSIGSHTSLRGDEAERLLSGRKRFGIWKNRRGVTNLGKQLNCSSLVKPSSIPPFCTLYIHVYASGVWSSFMGLYSICIWDEGQEEKGVFPLRI